MQEKWPFSTIFSDPAAMAGTDTGIMGMGGSCPWILPANTPHRLKQGGQWDMTIPNIITIARFLLVPAIIYALAHGQMTLAFALFVAAGVSDGIDGFIARQFNQRSELGAWMDPIADKLLIVSVFIMLGITGGFPDWLVILVVSRDVLIVGAVILASIMDQPMGADPIRVSKANTAAQILLVASKLLELAFQVSLGPVVPIVTAAVAVLTILSAASYLRIWMRHMGVAGRSKDM